MSENQQSFFTGNPNLAIMLGLLQKYFLNFEKLNNEKQEKEIEKLVEFLYEMTKERLDEKNKV